MDNAAAWNFDMNTEGSESSMSDGEDSTLAIVNPADIPSWATSELFTKSINGWTIEDVRDLTFHSVDDAEEFYNSYASLVGFSIRKDRLVMVGDIVGSRTYLCSKAGYKRPKQGVREGSSNTNQRLVTRCGCSASFRIKYTPQDGFYRIVQFNPTHNHRLAPSKYSQFLRSQRNVDEYSAHHIAELREVGIKPSKIMDVLVNSAGGFEWVGFTKKDLYNHVYRSTKKGKSSNDANIAMHYIQAIASKDPGVYCRYHTDSENRLTRIFYSDTISRAEYRVFGDVVVCDSTYLTNKFNLPFVFLVGVDNHHSTCVFACALVSDEVHETYQWIFETFLGCMEGKQPRSIITDGDRAMRSAIAQVMPMSRHRLCGWHLIRNSNGVCADSNFKTSLTRLITKRYAIPIFTHKWQTLLEKYGLNKGHTRWVSDMQQTCHLWAESYFANCFFAGMVTNGRAESTNKTLKYFVNRHLPLSQFFHKYILFLDSIRQTAMGKECVNSQSMPPVPDGAFHTVRTQLAQLYSLEIYQKVDQQIRREQLFRSEMLPNKAGSTELRFVVRRYGDPQKDSNNIYYVKWDRSLNSLHCCCNLMECVGYPCAHIFSVMKQQDIRELHEANLTTRWMKDARSLCNLSSSYAQAFTGPVHRLASIRPYCETLAYLSSHSDDHMQLAQTEIDRLCQRLSLMGSGSQEVGIPNDSKRVTNAEQPELQEPLHVRTKGVPRQQHNPKARKCGICKQPGHRRQTCKRRKGDDQQSDSE